MTNNTGVDELLLFLNDISDKSHDMYPEAGFIYKCCISNSLAELDTDNDDVRFIGNNGIRLLDNNETQYLQYFFENALVKPFPETMTNKGKDTAKLLQAIIAEKYKPAFMKIYDYYEDVHSKSFRLVFTRVDNNFHNGGISVSLDCSWSYD